MAIFKKKQQDEEQTQEKQESKETVKKEDSSAKSSMKDLYKNEKEEVKTQKKPASQKSPVSASKKSSAKETVSKEEDIKEKRAHKVLVRPLITEKVSNMGAQNKYSFEVSINANKVEVAKAIREVYGVTPVRVNMIKNTGKSVRFRNVKGKRKDWKKAIITIPANKSIDIYQKV